MAKHSVQKSEDLRQQKVRRFTTFTSPLSNVTIQPDFFGRDRVPTRFFKRSPYCEWRDAYLVHLQNMFLIVERHVGEINDENAFEEFCKLIYSKSSKYVTPFL